MDKTTTSAIEWIENENRSKQIGIRLAIELQKAIPNIENEPTKTLNAQLKDKIIRILRDNYGVPVERLGITLQEV